MDFLHSSETDVAYYTALELNDIPPQKSPDVFCPGFFCGKRENAVARLRKGVRPGPASSTIPFRVPSRESWTRQG